VFWAPIFVCGLESMPCFIRDPSLNWQESRAKLAAKEVIVSVSPTHHRSG